MTNGIIFSCIFVDSAVEGFKDRKKEIVVRGGKEGRAKERERFFLSTPSMSLTIVLES